MRILLLLIIMNPALLLPATIGLKSMDLTGSTIRSSTSSPYIHSLAQGSTGRHTDICIYIFPSRLFSFPFSRELIELSPPSPCPPIFRVLNTSGFSSNPPALPTGYISVVCLPFFRSTSAHLHRKSFFRFDPFFGCG
ncbi:hypothetical protein F5Y07DRAFT_78328 [Xylaria sp. FL0933]|nr:hypothetical protein F5Y07DRAFT_78328 [Xylaria sp. FL0933]